MIWDLVVKIRATIGLSYNPGWFSFYLTLDTYLKNDNIIYNRPWIVASFYLPLKNGWQTATFDTVSKMKHLAG